jgi:hypothetical protein
VAQHPGPAVGDQHRRTGVVDDASDTPHVVFQLRRSCRRVERHRNAAGVDRTVEGGEKFAAGGKHDGDAFARTQPVRPQPGGEHLRLILQLVVADVQAAFTLAVQSDVHPVAVVGDVPVKNVGEGTDILRRLL